MYLEKRVGLMLTVIIQGCKNAKNRSQRGWPDPAVVEDGDSMAPLQHLPALTTGICSDHLTKTSCRAHWDPDLSL